jgi:hypothetical protein
MEIPAEFAFNQGRSANHAAATQIAPTSQVNVAAGSDASTEAARNFVVAQINVRATARANCGGGCAADLLFSLTVKTLDDRAALSLPKILEPAKDRGTLWRSGLFSCPQFEARFWSERRKRAPALATNRAFGRGILLLPEATVRAFRTDFYRRRIDHWT